MAISLGSLLHLGAPAMPQKKSLRALKGQVGHGGCVRTYVHGFPQIR